MGTFKVPSPAVLKNRGVPVPVHKLSDGDGTLPPSRVYNDAEEPVFEDRYVKITNNALSDIEDLDYGFGGLEEWQAELNSRAYTTVRKTLAIVWGYDPRNRLHLLEVGQAMVDGQIDTYVTALGASYMIANGLDPTAAGELLEIGMDAASEKRQRALTAMSELIREAKEEEEKTEEPPAPETTVEGEVLNQFDSPGSNGYDSGYLPVDPPLSSGV